MATTLASRFVDLFPAVLIYSTYPAYTLTVQGAYALKVMTVVAVTLVPLVVLYQDWTDRVFRARVQDST